MADRTDDLGARFARNVRATRERRNLSQAQLAKKMSDYGHRWAQNTIQRIEHQQRRVDIAEADALARALAVTVDVLLADSPGYTTTAVNERIQQALDELEESETDLERAQQRHTRAARQLADLFPVGLSAGELRSAALAALETHSAKPGE